MQTSTAEKEPQPAMVRPDSRTVPSQAETERVAPFQPSPKESTRWTSQSFSSHASAPHVVTVPGAPPLLSMPPSALISVQPISPS